MPPVYFITTHVSDKDNFEKTLYVNEYITYSKPFDVLMLLL